MDNKLENKLKPQPLSVCIPNSGNAPYKVRGPDNYVHHFTTNSGKVMPGSLFAAYKGQKSNGHQYIEDAIRRGASTIIHSAPLSTYNPKVSYLRHPHPQMVLAEIVGNFYHHPSKRLYLIGITGTDGKSTVAWLVYQLLNRLNIKTGLISTVAVDVGDGIQENSLHLTTPEAPELHAHFAAMLDHHYTHAVVEASSHSLSPKTARLAGVRFNTAICTNITAEHLDFHGTMRKYVIDKSRLFRSLDYPNIHKSAYAISGASPAITKVLQRNCNIPIIQYQVGGQKHPAAHVYASTQCSFANCNVAIENLSQNYSATINTPWGGQYNIANLVAALLAASHISGTPFRGLQTHIANLTLPPGRRHIVCTPPHTPFVIMIDYAHTPNSFEALLSSVAHTDFDINRLVLLFGSAGERDVGKRALLGAHAATYANIIYLTNEDPRGESPHTITKNIMRGINQIWSKERVRTNCYIILDRAAAIRHAVANLQPKDILLLLGKGHEKSIIEAHSTYSWDEYAQVHHALQHTFPTKKHSA